VSDSAEIDAAYVVFAGARRVGGGSLAEAAAAAWRAHDRGYAVLVFDAASGEVTDLDLRGGEADVRARYAPAPASKRGRPRLGVVAREVTLLPRHWDWLARQPGGASVALRRLVDAARTQDAKAGAARARTEAAYRFMSAMAGDLPQFEEASRALFAGDRDALAQRMSTWPADIRDQVMRFLD
jgi:hypothetical protein